MGKHQQHWHVNIPNLYINIISLTLSLAEMDETFVAKWDEQLCVKGACVCGCVHACKILHVCIGGIV